jgi:hypothetical protein
MENEKKNEQKTAHRFDSTWCQHHIDLILCNGFSCRSKSTADPILVVTDLLLTYVPYLLIVGCPSICKSADCLSAHHSIFWFLGQQICHSQIFHFHLFLSQLCMSVCSSVVFFLVCCPVFCLFFWQDLDEAQYPTTPTSILQRITTAHSYPLLPSPHCRTHAAIRIVSHSGKIECSDSQEEGLSKFLYQAYPMLKKVKYGQIC